jgi:hypothetical protein
MSFQRIRRAAAVLAVAATLALAAPARATAWESLAAGPRWLEQALEWVAHLWNGNGPPTAPKPAIEKYGSGCDPNGCPGVPPPSTSSGSGG